MPACLLHPPATQVGPALLLTIVPQLAIVPLAAAASHVVAVAVAAHHLANPLPLAPAAGQAGGQEESQG